MRLGWAESLLFSVLFLAFPPHLWHTSCFPRLKFPSIKLPSSVRKAGKVAVPLGLAGAATWAGLKFIDLKKKYTGPGLAALAPGTPQTKMVRIGDAYNKTRPAHNRFHFINHLRSVPARVIAAMPRQLRTHFRLLVTEIMDTSGSQQSTTRMELVAMLLGKWIRHLRREKKHGHNVKRLIGKAEGLAEELVRYSRKVKKEIDLNPVPAVTTN